ncbi:unnamed protein product, partial [Parnassius apollo]
LSLGDNKASATALNETHIPEFCGASFLLSADTGDALPPQLPGRIRMIAGDSGYSQRPWIMTPILNAPQGSREELYTTRHVQARTCIERCFGLLKTRWRCLLRDRVLHYHPTVASKITLACCVLHNISVHVHLPAPSDILLL